MSSHTRPARKTEIVKRKIGRQHITRCDDGYRPGSEKFTQIHHIVCIASMFDSTISGFVTDKEQMKWIKECLKLTKWNINDARNTIGLPLKRAIALKPVTVTAINGKGKVSAEWGDLPCHMVDHNPRYTQSVSKRLNPQVWQQLLRNRKKCTDCKKECLFVADSAKDLLETESDYWRKELKKRGESNEGTARCWKDRADLPKIWFIPFSMDLESNPPRARIAPRDWKTLRKSLQTYLDDVMFLFKTGT